MGNFEISQMTGTGSATVKVKPKAINESEETQEQVLKISLGDIEREVTLVQRAGAHVPKETYENFVEFESGASELTWNFSEDHAADSTYIKSYRRKYVDGEPQGLSEGIPIEITSKPDWLSLTMKDSTTINGTDGSYTRTRLVFNVSEANPTENLRTGTIVITEANEHKVSLVINCTQTAALVTYEPVLEITPLEVTLDITKKGDNKSLQIVYGRKKFINGVFTGQTINTNLGVKIEHDLTNTTPDRIYSQVKPSIQKPSDGNATATFTILTPTSISEGGYYTDHILTYYIRIVNGANAEEVYAEQLVTVILHYPTNS